MTALWILTFPMSAGRALSLARPLARSFVRSPAHIYRATTARSQRSRTFTLDTGESTRGVYFVSYLEKSRRTRRRVILAGQTRQSRGNGTAFESSSSPLSITVKTAACPPVVVVPVVASTAARLTMQRPEANRRLCFGSDRERPGNFLHPSSGNSRFVAVRKRRWSCRSTAAWMLPRTCDSPNIRHKHRAAVVRGRAGGKRLRGKGSNRKFLPGGERERERKAG